MDIFFSISFVSQIVTNYQSHFHLEYDKIQANKTSFSFKHNYLLFLVIIERSMPSLLHACPHLMKFLSLV